MKTASHWTLPVPIRQKLSELRGLISRMIATQGLVVLLTWLLGSFILFGLIDYLPTRFGSDESPRIVRIIMLTVIGLGSLWIVYHYFWNRWLVAWSDSALALAIERHHPQFQSTLVTAVQAAHPDKRLAKKELDGIDHPNRPGMLELATRKASELISSIDVRSIVRFSTLQWELGILGLVLSISAILGLASPEHARHWARRLYGLSDAPWPRRTALNIVGLELDIPSFTNKPNRERYQVALKDGKLLAPKGSSARLRATAKDLLGAPYDTCSFHYRDRSGNRGRATMLSYSEGNPKEFLLDGPPLVAVTDDLWFSLVGGDARLSNLVIETVDAPLAVSTEVDVEYPAYLQRSTKTTWGNERLPYRNGMRLPQGTQVGLWVRANRPIKKCDVMQSVGSGREDSNREFSVELKSPATEFAIPATFLQGNLFVELRLWDDQGICATRVQQFVIAALTDNAPNIDFVLDGIGSAITEEAVLPIRSTIKDDHDLNRAWVESRVDEQETIQSELGVDAQGKGDMDIDLKAMRESGKAVPAVGSTYSLMVAASDFYDIPLEPGGTAEPHLGRSTPIQLKVVTTDQFLILLDRREAAMRRRLEQIISELGQLGELLVLTKKNNEAPEEPSAEGSSSETGAQRRARVMLLRSQQASAQAAKSDGELKGVLQEISQLVAELINNRIDSKDRRDRLNAKIKLPLGELLESQWKPFVTGLNELEGVVSQSSVEEFSSRLERSLLKNNEIVAALKSILGDMIEIQDLNEIIDRVRGLLDEQSKAVDRSKQEQKKLNLDSLK